MENLDLLNDSDTEAEIEEMHSRMSSFMSIFISVSMSPLFNDRFPHRVCRFGRTSQGFRVPFLLLQ